MSKCLVHEPDMIMRLMADTPGDFVADLPFFDSCSVLFLLPAWQCISLDPRGLTSRGRKIRGEGSFWEGNQAWKMVSGDTVG